MKNPRWLGSMLALIGLCPTASTQGYFTLDTSFGVTNRVDLGAPGNRYSGTFGLELWMLNGTNIPTGFNSLAALSGVAAYRSLSAQGFRLEQTFANQSMDQGNLVLGTPEMPDVAPRASDVVVVLATWTGGASSWNVMLAGADSSTRAGVIGFVQPTTDFTDLPKPAAPFLAWGVNQDLVMLPVPEPRPLALVGLGAALFLRRRSR